MEERTPRPGGGRVNYAELVLAIEGLRHALALNTRAISALRRAQFDGVGLMADPELNGANRRLGEAGMLLRARIAELDQKRMEFEE